MIQLRNLAILAVMGLCLSCGNKSNQDSETHYNESAENIPKEEIPAATETQAPTYDPKRGEGKFTAENVVIGASLDARMAGNGDKLKDVKCASCHKMTEEKLVGPGWKGVTGRHKPEWIMNFISNPDPMIEKDPTVQAQLELCLVRMPNQGLDDKDARDILEFMRKNDGVK